MDDFKEMERHESYGMAGFSRISCSGTHALFGSSIRHRDTIVLRINTAKCDRGLSKNWYHADKEILEVEMSKSQFSDLITSLNQGSGIPVTIRYFNGKRMEDCPYVDVNELHSNEFKELNDEANSLTLELIHNLEEIFKTKKTFSKADKELCLSYLTRLYNALSPNAEYALKAFQEQMENTITEAKGEIEAFFENKMLSIAQTALVEHQEDIKRLTSENPVEL